MILVCNQIIHLLKMRKVIVPVSRNAKSRNSNRSNPCCSKTTGLIMNSINRPIFFDIPGSIISLLLILVIIIFQFNRSDLIETFSFVFDVFQIPSPSSSSSSSPSSASSSSSSSFLYNSISTTEGLNKRGKIQNNYHPLNIILAEDCNDPVWCNIQMPEKSVFGFPQPNNQTKWNIAIGQAMR